MALVRATTVVWPAPSRSVREGGSHSQYRTCSAVTVGRSPPGEGAGSGERVGLGTGAGAGVSPRTGGVGDTARLGAGGAAATLTPRSTASDEAAGPTLCRVVGWTPVGGAVAPPGDRSRCSSVSVVGSVVSGPRYARRKRLASGPTTAHRSAFSSTGLSGCLVSQAKPPNRARPRQSRVSGTMVLRIDATPYRVCRSPRCSPQAVLVSGWSVAGQWSLHLPRSHWLFVLPSWARVESWPSRTEPDRQGGRPDEDTRRLRPL